MPGRNTDRARPRHGGGRRIAHRTRPEAEPEIAMTSIMLPAIVFDGVIDVSHHNGAIDWPAVAAPTDQVRGLKAHGIVLAFIKATQGTGFVDPAFQRNRDATAKAGILPVPYHFIAPSDPDHQPHHFLSVP